MKLFWLVFGVFVAQNVINGDEISIKLNKDEILRTRMSTKTIYPEPLQVEEENNNECTPLQVNYVIRHGTRFPTIKDITRISHLQKKLVQDLLASSTDDTNTHGSKLKKKKQKALEWLKDWKIPYPNDQAGWLADAGVHELLKMGRRLRERFGQDFEQHYHSNKYIFEHTWKIRTRQSALAFANGFFDGHQLVHYHTDPIGQDEELRFFDNCPAFAQQIDTNKTATLEHFFYRNSIQMAKNLGKFISKTKVSNVTTKLTQKDLEAAYAACAFDIAVHGIKKNWCRFFDKEMLLSMDFFHDLKHFYKKSHGHNLAWEIATPLLQDIFSSIKKKINGTSQIEGHFRFAHAETILPFATLLNLSQFDPVQHVHLQADFTIHDLMKRSFYGSSIAPFAANVGFVLYQCPFKEQEQEQEHYVKLLFNEQEVEIEECEKKTLCRFSFLEKKFQKWLEEYNFQQSCNSSKIDST